MSEPTIASVLDKSIDKLSGGAAEIAKAAKQVAPHAWEVAVRQQVIEGYCFFGLFFLFALVALVLAVSAFRLAKTDGWEDNGNLTSAGFLLRGAGVILFLLALSVLAEGSNNIARISNPEYAAGMALLEVVK